MIKFGKTRLFVAGLCLVGFVAVGLQLWSNTSNNSNESDFQTKLLADTISEIVAQYPAEIGVAVIIDNTDTVTVNNKCIYPMMSVFKLHQALAVCNGLDSKGLSLDTVMVVNRDELDPNTWSPMLKDHQESAISMTVKDLLQYTLSLSDNNASNFMFKRLTGVAQTDSFIATLIPRQSFRIVFSEEEMSAAHERAYENRTTPLGAAVLMNRLFTDSLVSSEKQAFIMKTLEQCSTGTDRIVAPLTGKDGITVAHKTGSGYINENGVLAAHNDVAYIRLPGGLCYTLAVFVKDFKGNEKQAAEAIARISAAVYSLLT